MTAVAMVTLSLSSNVTTAANKSDTSHRFFRTEEGLGLPKAETDLGPSASSPPSEELTRLWPWSEQEEMTQCSGQALSPLARGFHLGSTEGLPHASAKF